MFPVALALTAIACGTTPAQPDVPSASAVAASQPPSSPLPSASSIETSSPTVRPDQFEFDPESVALYYVSLGYACADPSPSEVALGHVVQSCRLVDPVGRTLVVGLVADPQGDLANAYASVEAPAAETSVDSTAALDPLAAFLGAVLGSTRGESLLPWLAGHLGDAYAETTVGDLRVATYRESETDFSKLYVEIGTPDYLTSPTPGAGS